MLVRNYHYCHNSPAWLWRTFRKFLAQRKNTQHITLPQDNLLIAFSTQPLLTTAVISTQIFIINKTWTIAVTMQHFSVVILDQTGLPYSIHQHCHIVGLVDNCSSYITVCYCLRRDECDPIGCLPWLIEQGLTSPPTQYRLYGRRLPWCFTVCRISRRWNYEVVTSATHLKPFQQITIVADRQPVPTA